MKKDVVLWTAVILAVLSSFFVVPSVQYLQYIDFRVLSLLFCLMLIVAGVKKLGVFKKLGVTMSGRMKSTRGLTFVMVSLCFFSSMLITNDVSLITFVPFTITLFTMVGYMEKLIPVIVLETIAANLGSMLTPIGNPQNLYLFSVSNMGVGEFILCMLPYSVISFVFIVVMIFFQKDSLLTKEQVLDEAENSSMIKSVSFWCYLALFVVCILNIFRVLPYQIVLIVVVIGVLFIDRALFKEVDYSLLITFVGFFIFVGNMRHIEVISNAIQKLIEGKEMLMAVFTSQVISNVPAVMLLSGFTNKYKELLIGSNIGGLGTLIASMASLISYKFYANTKEANKGSYIRKFTIYNLIGLFILYSITFIIF